MWEKQNQWKTVLKLDKNSQKETLFTVHMLNIIRKTKRRTLKTLKTPGCQNPERKIHVHNNMTTTTQATTLTSIKNRASDQALAQVA